MLARRRLRLGFAAALALTGCTALLDVKDIYLEPSGGTASPDATSPDGTASLDGAPDATTCNGDLQVDPQHCGRCGHSCQGGACIAGTCSAVVLAANLGGPSGIALDASNVYFTTYRSGTVQSIGKNGGKVTSLATSEIRAAGVTVFANDLYWANGDFRANDAGTLKGGIWRCSLPDCSARAYVGAGGYDTAAPVVRGGFVYFGTGEDFTVARVPLAGGAQTVVTSTSRAFALAVDDTNVYYTSQNTSLSRAPVAGGPPEVVGSGDNSPYALGFVALDDQRVYWAYTGADKIGHVFSVAKADVASPPIAYGSATDNLRPVGIAVDAENIYWATSGNVSAAEQPAGDGKLLTCKKVGCGGSAPVVLATGIALANELVVDEGAIYWAEYGSPTGADGRIRKVAKP